MKTRATRKLRYGDQVHMGGAEYILLPASAYPRLRGTGRKVVFDAFEMLHWFSGRDLRRDREAAGLTQAEVARRAGIRAETLSRLEHGRGNPTVGTVRKIVRAIQRGRRRVTRRKAAARRG